MLHPDSVKNTDAMNRLLEDVSKSLIRTSTQNGEGLIALPQTYPGGDSVVVRVQTSEAEYFVSDGGAGRFAAEMIGGEGSYSRIAPKVAAQYGVSYDGHLLFSARVSRDWLTNAIIFVGMASRRAVELTAEKMAEERDNNVRKEFQDRLSDMFPKRTAFNVDLPGKSTRMRTFAAMVEQPDHRTVFDLVTPHHVSINGAIVKFQDVAQLEMAPRRVAVLTSERRTDPADVAILSQWTSSIIRSDAASETLSRAA